MLQKCLHFIPLFCFVHFLPRQVLCPHIKAITILMYPALSNVLSSCFPNMSLLVYHRDPYFSIAASTKLLRPCIHFALIVEI